MNLFWIVLDAVRFDHLSCYGYKRPTTPCIDAIAAQGVRFEQVITPGARTWESFCSFLTGLYPQHHGVRYIGGAPLSPNVPTLAEILRARGYATFGRTADLTAAGLERGFADFDPAWRQTHFGLHRFRRINRLLNKYFPPRNAPGENASLDAQATHDAIKWTRGQRGNNFFALVRYLCAHWPYWPPAPFQTMFESEFDGDHSFNDYARREEIVAGRGGTAHQLQHAIAHYDRTIRFIDAEIGKLVESLKRTGQWEQTLLVIMSDHGEGLGEHGYYFEHGDHVYEHLIRVPLIIAGPGLPRGTVVTEPTQTVDVFPTALELLGVPSPGKPDGASLLPLIEHRAAGREYTFSESGRDFHHYSKRHLRGVEGAIRTVRRCDGWKLIYTPRHIAHEFALHYLPEDPGEERNLFSGNPEIAQPLQKILRDWIEDELPVHAAESAADETDVRVEERLRQLGYIE